MTTPDELKRVARREAITRWLVVLAIAAFLGAGLLEFWLQRR